ncbi:hypothetical protein [Jiella mangrovi]|uniref:Uncharacterized protein n=1 Tax=Jiella mangrovi TaxID=2821407 RepID=A0ABS4BMK2_9HYPH|nr:hypothetical protein [Jiella mangrovi]MBP0617967.1 hypothetical protein [Jiella mangrovi]
MTPRFVATFAATAISVAMATGSAGAQTAESPAPVVVAENAGGLADLVLPYTPYLFDFAVTSLRSIAEITYSDRRYDPITRSLVVTGLAVDRGDVHFRIGQMRIASDQMILDGMAIDTRQLPLDPTVRQVLDKLGRETVTGHLTVDLALDAPRADYVLQATARFDGIGAFDLDADLRGFHILAPLSELETTDRPASNQPEIRGTLASADIAFSDMGLTEALYDVLGREQGLNAQAAKSAAMMISGAALAGMFDNLPGGPTPELQRKARDWSAALQAFLKAPGRLSVALRPQQPFELSRLTDGAIDAKDIADLDPTVVNGSVVKQALLSPTQLSLPADAPLARKLALADTLLNGRGIPQDIGRALDLMMPAAMDGNRAAVALLAHAIAIDPYVSIAQEKLVPTYVSLDLALADGLPFSAESLAAIGRRLSPSEIVGAEDEAVATWRQTPVGQRQRAAEIEAFRTRDWNTIRRLAYAYYEGSEMPRNIMRAYGWSAIAAAGGDRAAAKLRDELTRAAGSGKLVLPLDRARKATDDLWALILGDDMSAPTTAGEGASEGAGNTPATGESRSPDAADEGASAPAPAGAPSDAGPASEGSFQDGDPATGEPATGGRSGAIPAPRSPQTKETRSQEDAVEPVEGGEGAHGKAFAYSLPLPAN